MKCKQEGQYFKGILNKEEPDEKCPVGGAIDEITTSKPTPSEVRDALIRLQNVKIQ